MEKEVKERKVRGQYCGVLGGTDNSVHVYYSRPHFIISKENGTMIRFISSRIARKLGIICPDSKKVTYNKKGYIGPTRGFSESK